MSRTVNAKPVKCTIREASRIKGVSTVAIRLALQRGDLEAAPGKGATCVTMDSLMRWEPSRRGPRPMALNISAVAAATSSLNEGRVWVMRDGRKGSVLVIGDPSIVGESPAVPGTLVQIHLLAGYQAPARVRYVDAEVVVLSLELGPRES